MILLAAPPPKQYSTPTLITPATQAASKEKKGFHTQSIIVYCGLEGFATNLEVNSLDSRLNNYCIKRYLMTEIVFSRVVGPSKIKHSTAENFLFLEPSLKKVMLSQIFMPLKFTGMSSLALGREGCICTPFGVRCGMSFCLAPP